MGLMDELIIDSHAHLGFDEIFDEDFSAAELLRSQEQNDISISLVQPATVHDLATVKLYHDAIAQLCRQYPGRFYGIANPNPHLPGDGHAQEVRRCVEQLGFVGIKLHPLAHAVNPGGRHGRRVFESAEELNVPVMVHTGTGLPWAAPALLAPLAELHPRVKIVLAHAGGMICAAEAGQLAARYPNVFLEVSWSGGLLVRQWVRQLGAQRIMFGSDHADNAVAELAKLRSLGLKEGELAWVLGGSAAAVFRIPARQA
jgi:predicted TIM-barrel fold metal-dependent hydrolase